jgi:phosphoglycerol transferase MdoB-like AlkP superfamily enzyme
VKNFSKQLTCFFGHFLLLYTALVLILTIGRGYEFGLLTLSHGKSLGVGYLLLALVSDLQLSVFLAPLIFGLGWLVGSLFESEMQRKVGVQLVGGIGIIHILLISYYGATLVPLGADLWAYSISELTSTVLAAERISFLGVVVVLGAYLCFIWIAGKILSYRPAHYSWQKTMPVTAIFLGIIFLGPSIISGDTTTAIQEEQRANKFSYFVSQSVSSISLFDESVHSSQFKEDYPLLRKAKYQDVLGPYFEEFDSPPNIVFVIVESLGGEFIGPSGQWTGFAPYLDSLSKEGLYWENGLSLSGRTFGLVPSLLGSLPFGDNGFMDLGPDYPSHKSLISLLDQRGYYTAFYGGYNTNFDGLNLFLEYQGTDFILNKQKLDTLLPEAKTTQNYWGVDDKTMLNFASTMLDTARTFPRLEIYHTLQSHSPFTVPNPDKYERQFDARLESLNVSKSARESFWQYRSELTTLMFADQAVQNFMQSYQEKKQFENTIFVFTGDHWLIPVPQTTAISRYHVPLIIYSPKLKKPVHFKSVNTHANVVPTLTALLDQQTTLSMPDSVHWLGGVMDTSRQFRSRKSVPLMRNKNRISDYLDGKYYLYGDELYELNEGLSLSEMESPEIKKSIAGKLNKFKEVNQYVTIKDKLYPGDETGSQKYAFLAKYDTLFARYDSLGLSVDQQFQWARQYAFDEDYQIARAIAKRILMKTPDYTDVRLLIGRTYAWNGQHQKAKEYFKEALRRDSSYYDIYNAYFDSEYWDGNYNHALDMINQGLDQHPQRNQFLERKIKALSALGRYSQAWDVFNQLKKLSSNDENLSELKKYLSK